MPMKWATMPKTPVNEHRKTMLAKYKVWTTRKLHIATPTGQLIRTQNGNQPQLG